MTQPSTDRGGVAAAIDTHGLTKRYGSRTVVEALDMHVPLGVIAGFVGPNGAGKTTTLRMLLGLVRPTAGGGQVLGSPLAHPDRYLPRVGALIESPAFYPGLSGERNLAVQAVLGGLDPGRIPVVLDRVGLAERGRDPYRTYSLGMKQRLGIAAALLGDPVLLILDEPANGLDPAGIREMRELLRSLTDDGRTVFVSSHLLAEVEQVCDWLVVIEQGRRVFQGSTVELLAGGADTLIVACEHPTDLHRLQALLDRRRLSAVQTDGRLWVTLGDVHRSDDLTALLADLNRAAMAEQVTIVELTVVRAHLEDRYLNLVSGGLGRPLTAPPAVSAERSVR
jgi:ABC-2 type transport system ATP-binding protein